MHQLSADKRLGQNFLLDFNLTRRIARVAGPLIGRTVIEIGPGPGGLTRGLLMEGAARVIVIERDARCVPVLDEIAAHYPGRVEIIMADALEVDWAAIGARAMGANGEKPVIAANLPYNVATMLLITWLETMPWPPWFERMVLMFQREVAERIVAIPDTKAYGRLAIISQWRTEAHLAMTLRPEAFTPPPKVSSAVVHFVPRAKPLPACDVKLLGEVTAAAFGQRRKMLRQSLKSAHANAEGLLGMVGIEPTRRGETLSVSDFARLADALSRVRGAS